MKNILLVALGVLLTFSFETIAQDGKKLFNTNCAACHKPDQKVIGPALKGKKQAWIDAGEGDLLYEWVKNAPELAKSGKSKMAIAAESYAPSAMTMQMVTNEEIDAIFEYVEAYEPKVATAETDIAEDVNFYELDKAKRTVDGWTDSTNRTVFWLQFILMFVLIIAIVSMSRTIQSLVAHKAGKKDTAKKLMSLLALIGFISISNSASAFDIDMSNEHWLQVTETDNMIFLGVNLVLLGIFFYMRGVFKNVVNSFYPEIQETVLAVREARKEIAPAKNVLTNMVPIEEEKSILLDHDYDGIQELDNHLPPWWVWSFYATILFAVYHLVTHHVINSSPDQITKYQMEVDEAQEEIDAYILSIGGLVDESTVTLLTDNNSLAEGAEIYAQNCATCHLAQGQGETGPNLTDDYWIYGNQISSIFSIVKYGQNVKGMPSHEQILSSREMQKVSSFVLSLPEVDGKAPQGELIKDAPVVKEEPVIEEKVDNEDSQESDSDAELQATLNE